jgi:hypothetical protein
LFIFRMPSASRWHAVLRLALLDCVWCPALQDALGADSPDDEGSQGLGQQVVRTINSLQRFAKSLTR